MRQRHNTSSLSTSSRDQHDERKANEPPSRRTQKIDHDVILSWIQPQDITNKIGEGSFGNVFSGIDDQGREVAVKVLGEEQRALARRSSAVRESMAKMFGAEIAVLSRLDHPNIVRLHGFGKFIFNCYSRFIIQFILTLSLFFPLLFLSLCKNVVRIYNRWLTAPCARVR